MNRINKNRDTQIRPAKTLTINEKKSLIFLIISKVFKASPSSIIYKESLIF